MLRRVLVTTVVVLASFCAAVAGSQWANILPKSWSWARDLRWVGLIAVAAILLGVLFQQRSEKVSSDAQRTQTELVRKWIRSVTAKGRLPRVAALSLAQFGVHKARVQLDYIRRDTDSELVRHLTNGDAVVVVGHSMSGKSRLAAEVVRRQYPRRRILMPAMPDALGAMASAGVVPRHCVVWLDELDQYLVEGGISASALDVFQAMGCVVVATMRTSAHGQLRHSENASSAVLDRFQVVRMPVDDEAERKRLAAACTSPDLQRGVLRYGLGEYVGAGYLAVQEYENGLVERPRGAAIVRAAVDWRRAGMPAIPESAIADQMGAYESTFTYATSESEPFIEALAWATQRIENTAWLVERNGGDLRAFDFIVDYVEEQGAPIPTHTWDSVSETCTDGESVLVGVAACAHNAPEVAERVWRRASDNGNKLASFNLGGLLYERGELRAAASLYMDASTEVPQAWNNLGRVLEDMGDTPAARDWFTKASDIGDPMAQLNLANLLIDSSAAADTARAGAIWAEHAAAGNPVAAYNHATTLLFVGDPEAARPWLMKSARLGFAPAMYSLACTLHANGKLKPAAAWYEKAIASSTDPIAVVSHSALGGAVPLPPTTRNLLAGQLADVAHNASNNLGAIYLTLGKLPQAEKWLRQAVTSVESPGSMYNLSLALARQGNKSEANDWLKRAADLKDIDAQVKWAQLRYLEGDSTEAEKYFRAAAKAGHVPSMYNLSVLLREDSRPEFETWVRRAAENGDPNAMSDLAIVLYDGGEIAEAEQWWHRAADLSHEDSLHNMVLLTRQRGERAQWKLWRRKLLVAQIKRRLGFL